MRIITVIVLLSLSLYAGLFSSDEDIQRRETKKINKQIHAKFRKSVSNANAIIKRGEYKKLAKYSSNISAMIKQIES